MYKKRSLKDLMLQSNLLFFVNSALWFSYGFSWTALVVALTAISSFMYHLYYEAHKGYHLLDKVCATVCFFVTLFAAYPTLTMQGAGLVLVSLVFGFGFKRAAHEVGGYDGWHTAWHMSVFFGQAILVAAIDSTFL